MEIKIKQKIIYFLIKNPRLLNFALAIFNKYREKKTKFKYFFHQNIVLHKYKAIYFPIPKSGSSSMKKIISKKLNIPGDKKFKNKYPEYYQYRHFPYVKKKKILQKYPDYFKFAFVRNPWDRVLSCYKNWIRDDFKKRYLIYKGFKKGMSFEEFVKAISKIPDKISEGHFRSQHKFIMNKKGKLLIDFVGKLENFEKDFKKICKKIGLPYIKIPKENKRKDKHYSKYYTKKTKDIIAKRYKKDILLFDYIFENKK